MQTIDALVLFQDPIRNRWNRSMESVLQMAAVAGIRPDFATVTALVCQLVSLGRQEAADVMLNHIEVGSPPLPEFASRAVSRGGSRQIWSDGLAGVGSRSNCITNSVGFGTFKKTI